MQASRIAAAGVLAVLVSFLGCAVARSGDAAPLDGTIAYAMIDLHWAISQTKDATAECPEGLQHLKRGPVRADGQKRTLLDTQLQRDVDMWYPTRAREPLPFHEASGPTALGLNLDGKTGPSDFTGPDGTK